MPLLLFWGVVVTSVALAARAFCYHHEDLGIYSQALSHLSLASPNPFLSARQLNVFNDHFDPILLLAAPLALLMPAWRAALLIEALVVSAAAVPLIWLVRQWRVSTWVAALLFTFLFLEPAVVRAVRFPVHPTTWALAPMMFVVACVLLERYRLLLLALVLLFACKEEFPFGGVMLGAALWSRDRQAALSVLALSVAWLAVAFGLRPWLLGETSAYGESIVRGAFSEPLRYLAARFGARNLSSGLWDFIIPLVPLAVWLVRKRAPVALPLVAMALPALAIRFLGKAWGAHYLAPLVPIAIGLIVYGLRHRTAETDEPSLRWTVVASLVLVAALDASAVRFFLTRTGVAALSAPHFCPADPARLAGIEAALEHIDGPSLVSGNLVAQLGARSDVYALGGFQPGMTPYRYVLLEKGALGDPFPLKREHVALFIGEARGQALHVLVDDDRLFFAEGDFVLPTSGVEGRQSM